MAGFRYGEHRYNESPYNKGAQTLAGTITARTIVSGVLTQKVGIGITGSTLTVTDYPTGGLTVTDSVTGS